MEWGVLADLAIARLERSIAEYLAVFVVAALFVVALALWRWGVRRARGAIAYFGRLKAAQRAVAREKTAAGLREGRGLWLAAPIVQPAGYDDLPDYQLKIVTLANLKGGVGKTTLSANLGAVLAAEHRRRVLLIDLDFQGSLTNQCFASEGWALSPDRDTPATRLISGDLDGALVCDIAARIPTKDAGDLSFDAIPAGYELAQAENRIMVEWLIGSRAVDPRYRLAALLMSKPVRESYDIVILDSPPRLSTAAVQALCASTHLLIPTILDAPSSNAAPGFVQQVQALKSAGVCPHIDILGVIGTMTGRVPRVEARVRDDLRARLRRLGVALAPEEMEMPRSAFFTDAQDAGVAWFYADGGAKYSAQREALNRLAQRLLED